MQEDDFSKDPYKKQVYETYALWKSLPSFLKGQPRVALEKFGIEEETMFELLGIKTQLTFSKTYDVDVSTLTEWNKRLEKEGLIKDINSWARKLTPNVVFALYKNIVKSGRAHEVKAWFEIVENN
jgi:hypothetical protein